ncbi:ABC1 kinase family protein [Paradesulfitobacterium ferrireducens]|uniref:ABC1 kinase family protein n=1 Tax=Paradesulfitobacterium ferrireducens TaxID=2816476 RepID=UPI001A8E7F42|nr:AarF/ABC1/UbiB kinase family protein [Paradesulfitobacterium ferrireducens]
MLGRRIRHLGRYRDVAAVLVRHGFGLVVEELGLSQLLSLPLRLFRERDDSDPKSVGERIRKVIEELGPTFIKIGQIASTRPDVIPAPIISELEQLQDRVPPFSYPEVQTIIQEELGAEIEQIFLEFEESPLAAASIGQVHRAVLLNGQEVAVKVQRPQISGVIQTDLEILLDLANLAEHRLKWAEQYKVTEMAAEFARSLRAELDYTIEGRNAEKIARQFRDDPRIHIPQIYWEHTTKKVLTMEYIQGLKLSRLDEHEDAAYDRGMIAETLAQTVLKQILLEGFFHADPHPGNIMVLPDKAIALIDFGMVGRLSPDMKEHFASLVIALMRQRTEDMIKAIFQMGLVPDEVNLALLRKDVDELRDKYLGLPLSRIHLGEAVNELFGVAFRHRILIPADLTLLAKALLTLEGIVAKLDPELSILDIARPFGMKLLRERYRPRNVLSKAWTDMNEYGEILLELPKQVKDLLRIIQQSRTRLEISVRELDTFLRKLDRMSNQISFSIVLLSFSIVMTGLIIASSLGNNPVIFWKIPAMEAGFVVAALMFLWLLFSIFRSGRF